MPKKLYIVTQSVFNIQHFVSVTYTSLLQFDVGVRNLIKERKNIFFVAFIQTKQTIIRWSVLFFGGIGIEDSHHSTAHSKARGTAMCRTDTTHNAGYGIRIAVCAYPTRRSTSSLVRRREWVSSRSEYPYSRPRLKVIYYMIDN